MSTRPLSERHHDLGPLETVYEVRVWDDVDAGSPGWRTLCCCARPEDAALLASATVSSAACPVEFAEIWAPSEAPGSPRRVVGRFPPPTPEEKQDVWRRAVAENYATAYVDLKH
jgi:hypothetical protein